MSGDIRQIFFYYTNNHFVEIYLENILLKFKQKLQLSQVIPYIFFFKFQSDHDNQILFIILFQFNQIEVKLIFWCSDFYKITAPIYIFSNDIHFVTYLKMSHIL